MRLQFRRGLYLKKPIYLISRIYGYGESMVFNALDFIHAILQYFNVYDIITFETITEAHIACQKLRWFDAKVTIIKL